MATTRIMPLHIGKGRTESQAVSDIIDYVENPQKTDNGRLITGYGCDSRTADAEFLLAKRQYIAATGRVRGADDVIAYHVRQSFKPGEITPEEANRLGVEFAKRFTKGKHAFVVCTHIDKSHTHNHIIWSAVNTDCDRKFRNFWGSTRAVRRLSDTICIENGLSIVENPKPHGKSYNKWLGSQAKPSHRETLRIAIGTAIGGGLVITSAFAFAPEVLTGLFIKLGSRAADIAVYGFPYFAAAFVFYVVNITFIGYFQSIERIRPAMAFALLRGCVFLVPSFLAMPRLMGHAGIWLALAASEALTTASIAAYVAYRLWRKGKAHRLNKYTPNKEN